MLVDNLKTLLATSYSFSVKTANSHWNIEGGDFPQYHEFLGEVYADIYDQIDKIAEYSRTLEAYVPASLGVFKADSIVTDQDSALSDPYTIFKNLLDDNAKFIDLLNETFDSATAERQQGIANFIAERLDAHQKLQWKVRSILKNNNVDD